MIVLRRIVIGFWWWALWIPAQASNADSINTQALDCRKPHSERQVVETTLATVPAIARIPRTATLPPILLWHGFGPPDSRQALMAALPLDDVPAIKVYLALPMFGPRMHPGGMAEIVERQKKDVGTLVFAPVVMGAADELRSVAQALSDAGCLDLQAGVGLFGFSAGGASTLLALADRKVKIKAAVTLNASTGLSATVGAFERAMKQQYVWTPESRKLADRSDAVKRAADIAAGTPALLIIHGAHDEMLPPQTAVDLYESLLPFYARAGSRSGLQLALVPELAHAWIDTPVGDRLQAQISQWFRQYL